MAENQTTDEWGYRMGRIEAKNGDADIGAGARCARCHWPLTDSIEKGCTAESCSCRCGYYPRCLCGAMEDANAE